MSNPRRSSSPARRAPLAPILALALALALGLGAAGPALAKPEALTPLAVETGFDAAAAAPQAFTVTEPAALKGIRRVAVPVFAVEFITADNVSASVSGFGAAGRATSSLY
jgi:hypothetical protein